MTNEQKAEAYLMRLNGASLQEIAEKFGTTKQNVALFLPGGHCKVRSKTYEDCIYPNIAWWLYEHRISYSRFSIMCGCSNDRIYRGLNGKVELRKSTIDKILEVTGMNYETAFSMERQEAEREN